ncbi:Structural maintenance of chromosomes protein 6 [Apophysomyces ossiformis]|uniref:Structural maintenance of chromosomes protein 6 n=1 Tax=Apophysomyces ossiformis TaxID=679940 RepID=A0A8H7EQS4_9FUNG|nr:Structural maintenance of chromosomes protein 6 [Apophysomyces ossiformis]
MQFDTDETMEDIDLEIDTSDRPDSVPMGIPDATPTMEIAEAGTIAEVEAINFMCHRNLKVELGPKINFVTGHNGSGKSAILTAITIALGAKANYTNRGKNLGALIREGASVARVAVRLTNKGPDSFRHDIYGDSIWVERQILKDGTGGYRIRNHARKLVSGKREDLDAICDHMSIQVDNPLTMLTQDGARQFLTSSSPVDKYKLFMRGTQLAKLQEDYDIMQESISTMKTIVDRKRKYLPELKARAREAQLRYKQFLEVQDIDSKIDELNNSLVWAQILRKERTVKELQEVVANEEKVLERMQESMEENQNKAHGCVERIKQIKDQLNNYTHQSEPYRLERQKLARERIEIEMRLKEAERDIRLKNEAIQEKQHVHTSYDHKIQSERRRLGLVNRDQLVNEVVDLEARKQQECLRIMSINRDIDELGIQRDQVMSQINQKSASLEQASRISESLRRGLENLHRHAHNSANTYHANMPQALDDISAETRWRMSRPVGPFGAHVHLERPEYAELLEKLLSNLKDAFAVECFDDKARLTGILNRRNMSHTPILVAKRDLFDYSEGEPDPKYLTVLRAVHFDNEWVKRQYIISNNIEQTLLMENREEADRLMLNRPHNVKRCYTKALQLVGSMHGMRTHALEPYRGLPWLTQNVEPAIREKQRQLEEAVNNEEQLATEIQNLNHDLTNLHRLITEKQAQKVNADQAIRQIKDRIQQLQEQLQVNETIRISVLQAEKDTVKDEIALLIGDCRRLVADKVKIEDALKDVEERFQALQDRYQTTEALGAELENDLVRMENERGAIETHLHGKDEEFKDQKMRISLVKADLQRQTGIYKDWVAKAMAEYPDRVNPADTPEEIQRRIEHLEIQQKEKERAAGMSVEEAENEAREALTEWNEARTSLSEIDFLIKRGDSGHLRFDHEKERLVIQVATGDQYQDSTRTQDSKSLSGGEKSFSQVSLLLALWQGIASPVLW